MQGGWVARATQPPRTPRGSVDPSAPQMCRYRGAACGGCGVLFREGESTQGCGPCLVHRRESCVEAATRSWRKAVTVRAQEGAVGIEDERVSQATADDARAYSIWTRLEREFVFGESRGAGGVLLPRHSRARFLEFVHWMAADSTRAAHLEDVRCAVGVFVPETRLADWSADREVAEELRRLIEGRRERASDEA